MPPFPLAAYGVVDEFAYGPAAPFLVKLPAFAGNVTGTHAVGGSYVERVKAVSFALTTVGGAGTRIGLVSMLDEGGAVIAAAASPFTVAAGFTSQLTFAVGALNGGAANAAAIVTSLPPVYLQPLYSVVLSVIGGLAADTVAAPRVLVDRFSTDAAVYAPGQGGRIAEVEEADYAVPVAQLGGA